MRSNKKMKKIGLIGGLSYPSTITYYERINRLGNQHLGEAHSPHVVIESLDFQRIADWLTTGDKTSIVDELASAASRLTDAGAELVAMCCNTVHKYASEVQARLDAPIVNICRCTADHAALLGYQRVGLLGSTYSMEESFYHREFDHRGIDAIIPLPDERRFIQHAIEAELSVRAASPETRRRFLEIGQALMSRGAQTLVLACTEIPLVIRPGDLTVLPIDTVEVHVAAIVAQALLPDVHEPVFHPEALCVPTI